MEQLKEFMLLFRLNPSHAAPSPEQLLQTQKQWSDFIANIAMQGKLVSTHQLGFDGKQITADYSIKDEINICQHESMSGNMILKAPTLERALQLAKKCPILLMGGTIEVRNIIPMNI
ncbi:hypothetical protein [uncultured Arcticibacterium sp.]|uniref:YciI family protein n=1 Tax=uncultured Arcticibacterium sp. TaxID=2173042 RepID=UPI0030F5DDF7